jgi:hypothetical protein
VATPGSPSPEPPRQVCDRPQIGDRSHAPFAEAIDPPQAAHELEAHVDVRAADENDFGQGKGHEFGISTRSNRE